MLFCFFLFFWGEEILIFIEKLLICGGNDNIFSFIYLNCFNLMDFRLMWSGGVTLLGRGSRAAIFVTSVVWIFGVVVGGYVCVTC